MLSILNSKSSRERGVRAGSEGIAGCGVVNTLLLNSAIDIRSEQFHAPADLSQTKEPRHPLNKRMGGMDSE
jgi:hypothetical protein